MANPLICRKCKAETPPEAKYCPMCGVSLIPDSRHHKSRANGTGSVWRLDNGHYIAMVTLGYYVGDDGTLHRKTRSKCFTRKTDAIAAIPALKREPVRNVPTLRELYDKWKPTHRAGKSTMDCYAAAFKYFGDLQFMRMDAIEIDDLQECIDNCGHGRRTQENMRAALGLMYKYGIPRHLIPGGLNLAQYLHVGGEGAAHRDSFTDVQIEQIRRAGTYDTDTVLCMIYLGFRPSEFLSLTAADYNWQHHCFVGGAKTEAGKGRTVTVSPKVLKIVEDRVKRGGYFVHTKTGGKWTLQDFTEKVFYPALDAAGIDNPVITVAEETPRHKYTPHSCRHTFATLMKRAAGSDKDKLQLIGHTSNEQLRDYQDVHFDDLQKITDAI